MSATHGKLWWLEELGCAMATDNLVPSSVLGIHHLGLAVRDFKKAIAFYLSLIHI